MSAAEGRTAAGEHHAAGADRRPATADERALTPADERALTPADERALTPAEQAVAAGLAPFRARLDEIDARLVDLLGERFQICRDVAVHKAENSIEMMQPGRVEIVRARYLRHGAAVDLPADFTAAFFDLLIDATCRAEDELMERLTAGAGAAAPVDGTPTQGHVPYRRRSS